MIVCHCNYIQSAAIEHSARKLCAGSGDIPTPREVYGAMGMQPCCGGCLPLAKAIISSAVPMSAVPEQSDDLAMGPQITRGLIAAE
jgi:bacterioferritin-associated ferredoxin